MFSSGIRGITKKSSESPTLSKLPLERAFNWGMCGIIGYFTDPKYGIFVAAGINTALTMLQHRGQGLNLIGK